MGGTAVAGWGIHVIGPVKFLDGPPLFCFVFFRTSYSPLYFNIIQEISHFSDPKITKYDSKWGKFRFFLALIKITTSPPLYGPNGNFIRANHIWCHGKNRLLHPLPPYVTVLPFKFPKNSMVRHRSQTPPPFKHDIICGWPLR